MGYVQIGKHVIVNGEIIATATSDGKFVESITCDNCNEIKPYADGFTFADGCWTCNACKAVN